MVGVLDVKSYFGGKFALSAIVGEVKKTEWVFRLHYVWTTWLLIFFTFMLSYKEWVDEHIRCTPIQEDSSNDPVIPKKVVHTYCYISSTFTVPYDPKAKILASLRIRNEISYKYTGGPAYVDGQSERTDHAYYQWVIYFLFFQAVLFQLTSSLWNHCEQGRLDHFVTPLNERNLKLEKEDERLGRLAKYLVESRGQHGWWSSVYVLCEFLNLGIIATIMWLTNWFLGGEFTTYGWQVLDFMTQDPEERSDPMSRVFPKITKCLFRKYGPSGNVERFDTTCVLGANIVNEKIFAFLWFWYIIVAALTVFQLGKRIGTLISVSVRCKGLGLDTYPSNPQLTAVVDKMTASDWILLRLIRLNLPANRFQRLINKIHEEISAQNGNSVHMFPLSRIPSNVQQQIRGEMQLEGYN